MPLGIFGGSSDVVLQILELGGISREFIRFDLGILQCCECCISLGIGGFTHDLPSREHGYLSGSLFEGHVRSNLGVRCLSFLLGRSTEQICDLLICGDYTTIITADKSECCGSKECARRLTNARPIRGAPFGGESPL